MKTSHKKTIAILLVVILLTVFVPQHQARAGFWWDIVTGSTLGTLLGAVNVMLLQLFGSAIGWAAKLLDAFISYQPVKNVFVVDQSWALVRDFVNLFFIIALIIMAFGTIFNIRKYTWKKMLVPFLIAALLVNFSLVIGQYIVEIANGLSSVFLKQIGNPTASFGTGTDLVGLITNKTSSLFDEGGSVIISALFSLIFLILVFLAMFSAAIFSLVRLIVIWFLLIISPIAWLGYSLPNIRSQTWGAWWKQFWCWCFFLPYYLFFLAFAVIFIQNKSKLIQNFPSGLNADASLLGGGFKTFNDILFYALSLIFLVGGLAMAMKLACASGTGVKAVFSKIEGGVRKYVPGAAYVRATYGGAKEGLAAKAEEIKERGVPVGFGRRFEGEQAERLRTARVAERFGFGAKAGEAGRVQMAEIEKEAKRIKEVLSRTPADQQKALLENSRSQKGVIGQAAALEYVKQGYSTLADYQEAVKKYGGENSAFARQYLENLKQAKLSDLFKSPDAELRIARGEVAGTEDLANLRRELYKDLAKRNQISNLEDYKEAKQLLGPIPAELKSFLDSIKPEYIVGTREARQNAITNRTLGDAELERKLVEFMKDKKEINNVPLRQEALAIVGGKDTIEGRNVINEINKFNPIINIEAILRAEREIPVDQPLSAENNERIVNEISDKISSMEPGDIRKLSGDFFKNPSAQEAFRQTFDDPEELSELLKNAPKEMRRALKNLSAAQATQQTGKTTPPPQKQSGIITPPPEFTGRSKETQQSREDILRELGKIP